MLIVTGTKRSGTSMWMQILTAAGFPAFGEAFPRNWGETLKDANPDGFYESILRQGIYWRTNPHPRTGAYFFPEQVERHVVKVFIPGLVRTDRAYIGSVVATVRHWREYHASLERLYAMEDEARAAKGKTDRPVRIPPVYEWWSENFSLIRDLVTRRHRVHVQSYDGLLANPKQVIEDTLAWLGDEDVDVAAAVAAVKPKNRTQSRDDDAAPPMDLSPKVVEAFDLLYRTVDERSGLDAGLITRLNEAHVELAPKIVAAQQAVAKARAAKRGKPAP
ncbi:MAG: hypothetical protein AAGA54_11200 [Myxococcota bacterium]